MVLFEVHQGLKGHFLNELRVSFKDTMKAIFAIAIPWSYNTKQSNNSVFLCLKVYWNRQVFDLICASGIWTKSETLRHLASSSKF